MAPTVYGDKNVKHFFRTFKDPDALFHSGAVITDRAHIQLKLQLSPHSRTLACIHTVAHSPSLPFLMVYTLVIHVDTFTNPGRLSWTSQQLTVNHRSGAGHRKSAGQRSTS